MHSHMASSLEDASGADASLSGSAQDGSLAGMSLLDEHIDDIVRGPL